MFHVLFFLCTTSLVACQLFDDYAIAGMPSAGAMDVDTSGMGYLGTRRTITNDFVSPTQICGSDGVGSFIVSTTHSTPISEKCTTTYDGLNAQNIIGNNECDCFNVAYNTPPSGSGFAAIEVNGGNGIMAPVTATERNQCLTVPLNRTPYQNVDSLQLSFFGNNTDLLSVNISHVCCIPSVVCRHVFASKNLSVGETSTMSMTCQYVTPSLTFFGVSFDRFATIDEVPTCTGENVGTIAFTPGDSSVTIRNTPILGSDFSCTITFTAIEAGIFDPVVSSTFINSFDSEISASSRESSDAIDFLDPALCMPGAISTLQILVPIPPSSPCVCPSCDFGASNCINIPFPGNWAASGCVIAPSGITIDSLTTSGADSCILIPNLARVTSYFGKTGNDCVMVEQGGTVENFATGPGNDCIISEVSTTSIDLGDGNDSVMLQGGTHGTVIGGAGNDDLVLDNVSATTVDGGDGIDNCLLL